MNKPLLILSILFTSFMYCQDNSTIVWRKSKKLTWSDFLGDTKSINYGQAKTSYQIRIIPEEVMLDEQDRILDYDKLTVQAEFNKYLSWSTAKFDTVVLQHEQLHFDIAELYARKIRKMLSLNKNFKEITYDTFWTAYKELWSECTTLQKKFDRETNHGRNFEQNTFWKNYIDNEIEKLVEFE